MQIIVGKSMKRCKDAKYCRGGGAEMAIDIFTVFLKALDASFGVHHRKTLLFMNNYAAHLQGMSLVRTVSTVYYTQTAQAFYTFRILSL
jgi:hypothetical protein